MPTITINISGSASISQPAERACLKIEATDEGTDKQIVVNHALEAARHIDEAITQTQDQAENQDLPPIAHQSKSSMSSTSYTLRHDDDASAEDPKRMYLSTITFDVRFRDFVALGKFTARLSQYDYCEIQSIQWTLLDATRSSFESDLRRKAAQNTLDKAKDYCDVFCPGEKIVKIIPESIDSEGVSFGAHAPRKQTARRSTSMDHQGLLSFQPQEVVIRSTVNVVLKVETEGVEVSLGAEKKEQDRQ